MILRLKQFFYISILTFVTLGYQNCTSSHEATKVELDSALGQTKFQCDAQALPSHSPQRRLSRTEYTNTLNALLNPLSAADVRNIKTALAPVFDSIPLDNGEKYDRSDSQISQSHVAGYLYVAQSYAKLVTENLIRTKAYFGTCATLSGMTDICLTSFLNVRGKNIYRRPLTAEEVVGLKADYQTYSTEKNYWLLVRMLMSPNFLMHIENRGTEIAPELYEVNSYELANRLSYHFLQSMPDDELLAAAEDGSLKSDQGFAVQIARLSADDGIRNLVDEFYHEWLGLDTVPDPSASTSKAYMGVVGGAKLSRESMIREIKNLTRYHTFEVQGGVQSLLTSDISFAEDPDLAGIYGVQAWDRNPANLIRFPKGERSGLLTRAAFLVNPSPNTNPVLRGLRIRQNFFCDVIDPPPDSIMGEVREPDFDPLATTRERYTVKTRAKFCMDCHSKINPLGFALEGFDSLGRYRTTEKIFDEDGVMRNALAVNTAVEPKIYSHDSASSNNAEQFSSLIADSGKVQACLVREYFQFTYARKPDLLSDGCSLSQMSDSLTGEGGSLKRLFTQVPLSKNFRLRRVPKD